MDLQQELAGLGPAADDAVRGVATPPSGDLWTRGERWRRRRRRGTALVAVTGAVLVAALSLVTVQRAASPEPAVSPGSTPTLPDRVYAVSPWLPVEVPGEPVVAVRLTERSTWTGAVPAIAVLTGSGRYLHLDAPDVNDQASAVLSPDGRRVAYWASGEPSGTPNTSGGQVVPVTAVSVVDVVTGDVERHDFETEHGLDPSALVWADTDTLLGGQSQWVAGDDGPAFDQGMATFDPSWRWEVDGRGGPSDLGTRELDSFTEASGNQVLVGRRLHDLATGDVRRLPLRGATGSAGFDGSNAFLREDGLLAQLGARDSADAVPNIVTVSDLRAPEVVQEYVAGTVDTWQVLGWRDGDLLTTRESESADLTRSFEVVATDVADGASQVLLEGDEELLGWDWATDLLGTAPVVDGVAPPTPMDPREVLGLGVTLLVVTVAGLVVWRRRVEP